MEKSPPSHMLIRQGHITLSKKKKTITCTQEPPGSQTPAKCVICSKFVSEVDRAACTNLECTLDCHLLCLSQRFLEPGEYVPISGSCPICRQMMLWSDVVRKFKGYSDAVVLIDDDDSWYFSSLSNISFHFLNSFMWRFKISIKFF